MRRYGHRIVNTKNAVTAWINQVLDNAITWKFWYRVSVKNWRSKPLSYAINGIIKTSNGATEYETQDQVYCLKYNYDESAVPDKEQKDNQWFDRK